METKTDEWKETLKDNAKSWAARKKETTNGWYWGGWSAWPVLLIVGGCAMGCSTATLRALDDRAGGVVEAVDAAGAAAVNRAADSVCEKLGKNGKDCEK